MVSLGGNSHCYAIHPKSISPPCWFWQPRKLAGVGERGGFGAGLLPGCARWDLVSEKALGQEQSLSNPWQMRPGSRWTCLLLKSRYPYPAEWICLDYEALPLCYGQRCYKLWNLFFIQHICKNLAGGKATLQMHLLLKLQVFYLALDMPYCPHFPAWLRIGFYVLKTSISRRGVNIFVSKNTVLRQEKVQLETT